MGDTKFPEQGRSGAEMIEELGAQRSEDIDWRGGKAFSLVYNSDDEQLEHVLHEFAAMFLHENALNPFRYKTLLRMETEIISMATDLVGAGAGAVTSGGTESIFLAVLTAREEARTKGITSPTIVCCDTAHPAFAKACKYLGVEQIRTPHGADGRADVEQMADAIDDRTALVVVSSPCYPYGVIDPVTEIAALAASKGTLCHVDACLGGFLLPWWERLGEPVVPWDFRVPGVTSMSADIHKYGYTFKGASMVMYRDRDLYQHQIFMYDDWPGGLYASATAAGTRPGAPLAGAWAALTHLGADGYTRLAQRVLTATKGFVDGINSIDGLRVTHEPDMSLFEFGSDEYDMDPICDVMDDRDWNLDRQQGGLHLMVAPGHDRVVESFCEDLAFAAANHGTARGDEHIYGGVID